MISLKKTLLLSLLLSSQFGFSQYIQSDASKKFDALLQYVEYAYVDSTDDNKLVEDAIVAVLKELDPHSVYIPKGELK